MRIVAYTIISILLSVNSYLIGHEDGFNGGYLSAMFDVKFGDKTPEEYFDERFNSSRVSEQNP